MNHTQNYQLSQWVKSDKVQMEDFNADNAKIDAAMKTEADARTALAALVDKKGNCRMETQSYTGNGKCGASNPTVIAFPAMPDFFIIFGSRSVAMGFGGESCITSVTYTSAQNSSFGGSQYDVTWNGCSMKLVTDYVEEQLNASKSVYHVVSFYKMDS